MPHQHQPDTRRPLVIEQGLITAGEHTATVDGDRDHEIVRAYLRVIRRARGDWRHRTIAVRRADVAILAEHLGWSEQQVLAELADLVGSSRRQRAAMFALLAAGASLITIAEPVAASSPGMGPPIAPPVVIEAPELRGLKSGPHGAAEHDPADAAPGHAGSQPPVAQETTEPPRPEAVEPVVGSSAPPTPPAQPEQPVEPLVGSSAPPAQPAETAPPTADPAETGAPSQMATVDDAIVAVGQPPVPPATDDDGNAVAVGQPPVPPAVDDDGNAVAVGQPPVPPQTDG